MVNQGKEEGSINRNQSLTDDLASKATKEDNHRFDLGSNNNNNKKFNDDTKSKDSHCNIEGHNCMQQDWKKDNKYLAFKYVTALKILPLQELAFNCVDELLQQQQNRKEKQAEDCVKSSTTKAYNVDDILWSKEPRLFALEYNNEGKRKYISSHLGRFIHYYWRECDAKDRHYYELIREKNPCRLYFDIEYNKRANPGISDETNELLLEEFISELVSELKTRFNLLISREHIVDLDSSTDKKFSRHFIVHLPKKELFADAVTCGIFVKRLIGRLAEEVATGEMATKGKPILQKYLFMYTKECSEGSDDVHRRAHIERPKTCFVDTGVYTRNRIFRILGSMKNGKPTSATLRIASTNEFPFPARFENSLFYNRGEAVDSSEAEINNWGWNDHARALVDTFVIPIEEDRRGISILEEINANMSTQNQQTLTAISSKFSNPTLASTSARTTNKMGSSPFSALDSFVRTKLAMRKSLNGSIRSWSMDSESNNGEYDELSSSVITYQIKDNRWCENIQRCHKSNNVMWHVSISELKYWQSCHDPDCRMASFRSERKDLPADARQEINTILSAKYDDISESFEKALLELSFSKSPPRASKNSTLVPTKVSNTEENYADSFEKDFDVDESFERALLNLNLSGSGAEQRKVSNDFNNEIRREEAIILPKEYEIDEEFEKALLNLKL